MAFVCPEDSSAVNKKVSFTEISNQNWNILASLGKEKEFDDRPLQLPVTKSIEINVKMIHVQTDMDSLAQIMRFDFVCKANRSKTTNLEFRKVLKRFGESVDRETSNRYCSGRNSLNWPSLFISFDESNRNLLMFYGCNNFTEFLTIFGGSQLEKVEVEKKVRNFLSLFESNLLEHRNLTYVSANDDSNQCSDFRNICRNKILIEETYGLSSKPMFESTSEFEPSYVFYAFFCVVIFATMAIICVTKKKVQKSNSVGVELSQYRERF
jgi:hypothetical protein